jgi:hypothetical protein
MITTYLGGPALIALLIGCVIVGFVVYRSKKKAKLNLSRDKQSAKAIPVMISKQAAINRSAPTARIIRIDPTRTRIIPAPETSTALTPQGKAKYPGMVFTEEGIKFVDLPRRPAIGALPVLLEPSLPIRGSRFMVVDKGDGNFKQFDARFSPIISNDTPQACFDAIDWAEDVSLYAIDLGIWEKINTILIGVICCGAFLTAIVAIDKLVK